MTAFRQFAILEQNTAVPRPGKGRLTVAILDLEHAIEKDVDSYGTVLIAQPPQVRSGKKNDFMIGTFLTPQGSAEFKIWEERTFATVQEHGVGIYDVETTGSEFNGAIYLTVRRIQPSTDSSLKNTDFLPQLPRERLSSFWKEVSSKLMERGVSYKCWKLIQEILNDPELEGRFFLEGAAIYYHDNKVGGLVYHTSKMLNLLAALLENEPDLKASADLLCCGMALHDIGKVFEYRDLGPGKYWYANHRIRGIEFIARHKDEIIEAYDEDFYRQLQCIIAEHHGEYGDRPTTIAAAIVHFIDTAESQITGLLESQIENQGKRVRNSDWGWLEPIPLGQSGKTKKPQD